MKSKIILITGFLGSGKTSLINYLLPPILKSHSLALIENEFGDASIDGQLLKHHAVEIKELSSGCICCSLRGDLISAIKTIVEQIKPQFILMEPSGIAQTSDIERSLKLLADKNIIELHKIINLIDARNFMDFMEDYGGFYRDQISAAHIILVNYLEDLAPSESQELLSKLKSLNKNALIISKDYLKYPSDTIWKEIQNFDQVIKSPDLKEASLNNLFQSITIKMGSSGLNNFEEKLKVTLDKFPEILRLKGFFKDKSKLYHIEYVYNHLKIEETNIDSENHLVIIGENLREEEIRASLR